MLAELITIDPTTYAPREALARSIMFAEAERENLVRSLATLEAGHCDHGATCEGTAYGVDCAACYSFSYNGKVRDLPDNGKPFTCQAPELLAAIKRVKHGVARKSYLPVLSGILFEDGKLTTTDMETTLATRVQGTGNVSIVAPAVLLEKVVARLSGTVTLTRDGLNLRVSAGSRAYTLQSLDPLDFPKTVGGAGELMPMIPLPTWREAWSRVEPAVSKDTTRPPLTGTLISGDTMVATDSYRLARYLFPAGTADLPTAIIPRRALEIVAKLKGDVSYNAPAVESHVCGSCNGKGTTQRPKYNIGRNVPMVDVPCYICKGSGTMLGTPDIAGFSIVDKTGAETRVYARPIEGQFPNYKQLLPDSFDMVATVNRANMIGAVDAVSVMAQKDASIRLGFRESLTVRAISQDVGEASETIQYAADMRVDEVDGGPVWPDFTIGFNPGYIADGLGSFNSLEVTLSGTSPLRPMVIGAEGDTFLYLIMPIRLSDSSAARAESEASAA